MVGLSKESVVGLEDSFNRDISMVYIILPYCYFVFFSHRLALRADFYSTAGDSVGAHLGFIVLLGVIGNNYLSASS